MTLKKKILVFLLLALSLLIISSAFLLPSFYYQRLKIGASILASFSSLFTLLIAILLYQKLTIDKSLLEKQTASVLSLLEEIEKLSFFFFSEEYAYVVEPINIFRNFGNTIRIEEDYGNRIIAFDSEVVLKIEELTSFNRNIYIPKEIADSLRKLKIYFPSSVKNENFVQDYVFLVSKNTKSIDEIRNNKNKFSTDIDPRTLEGRVTLTEHLQDWRLVVQRIDNWIEENSNKEIDLNFEI